MDQSIAIQDTLDKGENCTVAVQAVLVTPHANEGRLVGLIECKDSAAIFLYKHRRMAISAEDVSLDMVIPLVEGITVNEVETCDNFQVIGSDITVRITLPDTELIMQLPFGSHTQEFLQKVNLLLQKMENQGQVVEIEKVVEHSPDEEGSVHSRSTDRPSSSHQRDSRSKSKMSVETIRSKVNKSASKRRSSRDSRSRSRSRSKSRRHRDSSRRRSPRRRSRRSRSRSAHRQERRRRSPSYYPRYRQYSERDYYANRAPRGSRRVWSISPDSDPVTPFQRPVQDQCWSCARPALPEKRVCESCFRELGHEKESDNQQVLAFIQQAVQETFQNMAQQPGTSATFQASVADTTPQADAPPVGFDFALVPPFLTAIKSAIDWQEDEGTSQEPDKYYPHLDQKPQVFPLMKVIKEVVLSEWSKVEQKPSLTTSAYSFENLMHPSNVHLPFIR